MKERLKTLGEFLELHTLKIEDVKRKGAYQGHEDFDEMDSGDDSRPIQSEQFDEKKLYITDDLKKASKWRFKVTQKFDKEGCFEVKLMLH